MNACEMRVPPRSVVLLISNQSETTVVFCHRLSWSVCINGRTLHLQMMKIAIVKYWNIRSAENKPRTVDFFSENVHFIFEIHVVPSCMLNITLSYSIYTIYFKLMCQYSRQTDTKHQRYFRVKVVDRTRKTTVPTYFVVK